jgi:branched-chain amino acid transport system substrate-binding protein
MKKNFLLVLAAVLMLWAAPVSAQTVTIGVMGPITGQWASEGQDMEAIVRIMAEQFNAESKGRRVEIKVADDAGAPRTAALAAQNLAAESVAAVIGTYGSAITEASQDIYAEEGILQIATGSTAIRLTEKGLPLFFRTCPRDDEQGRVMADQVAQLGFKKVAVLHDNSSYAKGLAEEVKPLLAAAGITVAFDDAITPGDRDYTATLTKIKAAAPEAIIFTGYYPEAALLLRQKKEMGWPVPMIGGDATNNSALVEIAGREAAAGYYFISPPGPGDLTSPKSQALLTVFQERHNRLPSSVWSMMAGDAFGVLAQAVSAGVEMNGPALAAYLKNDLKDYEGLTGSISFNEKGDRLGDVYRLYQVNQGGVFELK